MSNLSGEFTLVNEYLVADLKKLGIWDEVMLSDLKFYDGSVLKIDRVPDEIKARYATAFEIEPRWSVEAGARRQKWIDQAQSLNIYMAGASERSWTTCTACVVAWSQNDLLPAHDCRYVCREVYGCFGNAQCCCAFGTNGRAAIDAEFGS